MASNSRRERERERESAADKDDRREDLRWAAFGGLAAGVIGFGAMAIVGTATAFEARRLLDALVPTVLFAASSYVAGGATILALMLTLITFSITHDVEFRPSHYQRIREIAWLTTAVIVGSVLLLLFLSFPIGEADVNLSWYQWVYYALLLGAATTGGVFISVILMLFYAVKELVSFAEDASQSSLVFDPEDVESD